MIATDTTQGASLPSTILNRSTRDGHHTTARTDTININTSMILSVTPSCENQLLNAMLIWRVQNYLAGISCA